MTGISNSSTANNQQPPFDPVGYTVVRPRTPGYPDIQGAVAGEHDVCLILPFVADIVKIDFDRDDARLDVHFSGAGFSLSKLPHDVVEYLAAAPARVLLVSVDTFQRMRSSSSADALMASNPVVH